MKVFQLIALLCLILYSYQECSNSNVKQEDCKADNLSSREKKIGAEYCCFAKAGDETLCFPLTKYQYKNIKDMIKMMRLFPSDKGFNDLSIDCKALYLQISLLSILLFLL